MLKLVSFIINACLCFLVFGLIIFSDPDAITAASVLLLLLSLILFYFLSSRNEKALKARISSLINELSVASSRISSVSSEINLTINENNALSELMFDRTNEMAEVNISVNRNIDETIKNIKLLMAYIIDIKDLANDMMKAGIVSTDEVSQSLNKILSIVDNISQISLSSSKADSGIHSLKASSGEINTIIDYMSAIFKQMHLITVNASIEASRAGQYGKSFAVVVKELQSLTYNTDKAITDISRLLYSIEHQIDEVCKIIKVNTGYVELGVANSQAVEDNLYSISASFKKLIDMISKVSRLADDEAALSEIINYNTNEVETLINKSKETTQQLYISAQNQKNSILSIASLGGILSNAASELDSISEGSRESGELDIKLNKACGDFFAVIENHFSKDTDKLFVDLDFCRNKLKAFMNKYSQVEAAWVNDRDGRFVFSIPEAGIANAKIRSWFNAAINGSKHISAIYISGITKNQCVTLSLPLYNMEGALLGVAGIDLNLDLIKRSIP
jgi:methyl-accepting chemotaxis protein